MWKNIGELRAIVALTPGSRFMKSRFNPLLCRLLWAALLCWFIAAPARARAAGLQTSYDQNGLATLRYGDLTLVDTKAHGEDAFWLYDVDGPPLARLWYSRSKTLVWQYKWGNVACQYTQRGEQLDLDISIANRGTKTIEGFNIFPLALRFPGFPKGYDGNTPHVRFNSDGPTVQSADFGSGIVTIINRETKGTLAVGLTTTSDTPKNFRYNLYVGSARLWYQPNNWPTFTRPIAPGARDKYQISLRFSPPGTLEGEIASDIYQQFAAEHPCELKWSDRRPIASLFLSSANNHAAKSPRGWFGNDSRVDVTTAMGRAVFRQSVLQYAKESIVQLKKVGAQGMITWDIEGQEYPHSTSYIGDPRLLGQLAPEMEPIADAYFAQFRAAGLRVGVCVRPQKLTIAPNGDADQIIVPDIAQQLIDRIQYAKTRWGATLFYVDSNGGPYDPTDATIFAQVARAHPDVLLIPEHQNVAYYAYTAPYNQLNENPAFTPPEVRRLYPNAFSVVKITSGNVGQLRGAIVEAARHGDVLMFNGWFDSEDGRLVREVTAEANTEVSRGLVVTTTRDVVSQSDGQTSLREAMLYANQLAQQCQITFAPEVRGAIKLNGTSLPTLTGDCAIVGPGAPVLIVDAQQQCGILRVDRGAKVVLSGLTLTGGNAGGSVGYNGGAVLNEGDLTIRASFMRGNSGNAGGAICHLGRQLSIERCSFVGNVARHVGGAIFGAGGAISLWQCTLSGNAAPDANGGGGGAICANTVDLRLESCTVAGNSALTNGAGLWFQGGVLTLHNTIMADNTIVADNGARDLQFDGGSIFSAGYNLVGTTTKTGAWKASDILGAAALLVAPVNNGGEVPTCAVQLGSAALNAGDPALSGTDQRGYKRVSGGRADIGAFEMQSALAPLQMGVTASGGSS